MVQMTMRATPRTNRPMLERALFLLLCTAVWHERVCYARAAFPRGGVLFEVLYTGTGRVTDIQPYTF
jgi:hypothetical protein